MSDYLPQEVLINILTMLPVNTLVQCTCVCKSWYSLITNPSFISTHLNRTIANNNNTHLLIRHCIENPTKEHYTLHFDDDTFDEYAKLQFPFDSSNLYFRVVGSCNGLLCLSDDQLSYTHNLILWNPSIRKSVTLPRPGVTFNSHGPLMHSVGFGFDPLTNDYKVVRIVHTGVSNDKVPPEVEIYSVQMGAWRNISYLAPPYFIRQRSPQVYMNGAVHWVASDRPNVGSEKRLILSFGMHDEVFSEIMLPNTVACESFKVDMSVGGYQGSLCLLLCDKYGTDRSCCIWVMKEYAVTESWTKLFSVDLSQEFEKPVGFMKKGGVLFVTSKGYLVCYDPKSLQIQNLGVRGTTRSMYWRSFSVDSYMESLVFLERGADFCDTVTSKGSPVLLGKEDGAVKAKIMKGKHKRKAR